MPFRKLFRKFFSPVATVIPIETLISISGQKRILPFYHSVSDQPLPHLLHVLNIRDTKTFSKDLDFFLQHFKPVDAHQLLNIVRGKDPFREAIFHLSFDDGLKECITIIAPVLHRKGIPATFFINTGFIGNVDIFYRYKASLLAEKSSLLSAVTKKTIHRILDKEEIPPGNLKKRLLSVIWEQKDILEKVAGIMEIDFREYTSRQKVYMDHEDIAGLQKLGFTLGSHSIDHPLFGTLSMEEQLRQLKESLEFLRKEYQVSPLLFSFPFTDEGVSKAFFNRIYPPEGILDYSFGISGLKNDDIPFHLHRIPMEAGPWSAQQIISGEYLYYMAKSVFRKNQIRRQ